MFAIYKILNSSIVLEQSNLELVELTDNLLKFKSKKYHINKYKLLNDGWCFIMKKNSINSPNTEIEFAEFVLIEIDSNRIKRKELIPLVRDLKLEKLLE
jgi:hypothetical protein